VLAVKDSAGKEIHRKDLNAKEISKYIKADPERFKFNMSFMTNCDPTTYIVWPHSTSHGWLNRIEENIG
jgi:hypothetical protein